MGVSTIVRIACSERLHLASPACAFRTSRAAYDTIRKSACRQFWSKPRRRIIPYKCSLGCWKRLRLTCAKSPESSARFSSSRLQRFGRAGGSYFKRRSPREKLKSCRYSCLAGERFKQLKTVEHLAEKMVACRSQAGRIPGRIRRWRHRRHDRFSRSHVHARHPLCAGTHHLSFANRFFDRRQNWSQPSCRQKSCRKFSSPRCRLYRPSRVDNASTQRTAFRRSGKCEGRGSRAMPASSRGWSRIWPACWPAIRK